MEIYSILDSADGANFQRQDGFSWEPDPEDVIRPLLDAPHLGLDYDPDSDLDDDLDFGLFVSRIQSFNHLLFVMHINGIISVWNWRKKEIIHIMKDYRIAIAEEFDIYDTMDDAAPMEWGMDCKHCNVIFGRNTTAGIDGVRDVAVWKFNGGKEPFSFSLVSEIQIEGYCDTLSLDIDADLAAVAHSRRSNQQQPFIYEIRLWDFNRNLILQIIECRSYVFLLSLDTKAETLLVVRLKSPLLEVGHCCSCQTERLGRQRYPFGTKIELHDYSF